MGVVGQYHREFTYMSAPPIYWLLDHTQATHPLLHRRGRVLFSFPKHPRWSMVEVIAMVFYYLDGMYVIYVVYADIPSGGFSIQPS